MDEETRKAFQQAIAQSEAHEQATEKQRQEQEKAQTRFARDFGRTLDDVILPAMGEITGMLSLSGWICIPAERPDGSGVKLEIYKEGMTGVAGIGRPFIEFLAPPLVQKVRISYSAPSQGSGGTDYDLSQITDSFVSKQILQFFELLVRHRR
jgi:hypothetical protein